MKVKCLQNNPDTVPIGVPNDFYYGLEINKEYFAMGLLLADKQLWYLIDENSKPNFYPFQLFQLTETKVNSSWYFKIFDEDDGILPFNKEAIWGYYELCFDHNHYEQLIDREREAFLSN